VNPAAGSSASVARTHAPRLVTDGRERPITVDQSNRSVVVDDAVIVKWFRPPRTLPHRGSEVLAHLREVGFDAMPDFFGTHVDGDRVVAAVAQFMADASDGWEWYLDDVHGWTGGAQDFGVLERRARDLGALAGRLHVALATPSSRWSEPVSTVSIGLERQGMLTQFEEARRVTSGVPAARLAARWDRIRAVIDGCADHADGTPGITIHGDLHVGNVLLANGRLVVTDFDGNPLADEAVVHQRPAAVDLASLLQSIDHVGRIVDHRTDGAHRGDIARFIDESVAQALDAYRTALHAAGLARLLDERMLPALRVAQELHELCYAAARLPHWVYVPDAALAAMFPDEDCTR
jgi:maltokinase